MSLQLREPFMSFQSCFGSAASRSAQGGERPAIARSSPEERMTFFDQIERRFAQQARILWD